MRHVPPQWLTQQKRKSFPKLSWHRLIFGLVAIFCIESIFLENLKADQQPNVLLIMTDDQGWGDIQAHGNDTLETQVLDELRADGATFERFYVSPVCAPTRASLLTGRDYPRTGVYGVTRTAETMRSKEVTMAELFQKAGYATGAFGKWHNGANYPHHPNGQGFDEFFGFCAGHWNNYFDTVLEHNKQEVKTDGYITDILTDEAIKFIQQHKSEPFFCYVPYNAPHSPWQVPESYFQKYKELGLSNELACCYGMVENIDWNVGRLLTLLEKLNLTENTIVLFLTDNGPNTDRYNGDMRGRKGSVHEGGTRVPLFMKWPKKIPAGLSVKPITAHLDLLPTLTELCKVSMEGTLPLDGKSLVPLLTGETANGKAVDWPKRMLFTYRTRQDQPDELIGMAARTDRWRAVVERNKWMLFDMVADPGQEHDLAEEKPKVMERFRHAMEKRWKDVSKSGFDKVPTEVGHPAQVAVKLSGHEAFLMPKQKEGIDYSGRAGWANDWITKWTDNGAYPSWPIHVVEEGDYRVLLHYQMAEADEGLKLTIQAGDSTLKTSIQEPFKKEHLPSPDREPRKEVYEKEWATLEAGTIHLAKGKSTLEIHINKVARPEEFEIKAISLIKE
ncbi:Arsenite-translocating ATPase ArsA [Planctomycetales bacterium 10988]|nr:Arsenite-translocating ATPase ArsA [Planctomycetales bacterium 10988]